MTQRRLVVCASHSPGMERDVERVQGASFREGLARTRGIVDAFDPDLVVLFGGDHRRAFTHVVPSFAVALSAGILPEGGHEEGSLDVPPEAARALADHLLDSGIDIAVCRDVALDHAFAQPLRDLVGSLDGRPVIPVAVNCATAPLPRASRVLALGDAVADFLDGRPEKILVIGTGGLSHSPPSLEIDAWDLDPEVRARLIAEGAAAARTKIRPEWDAAFLDALARWDRTRLAELTDGAHAAAGAGANEVRTWLAAGAAGGGVPLSALVYEPVEEWITGMAAAASV
ncbi:MAG: extradiol dioxygenase [Pseudonocardia sp.]|jgi:2,3-dihydroxyphenylpropionate 1,2-dioxygenase|uniref:3-carboxyethylcatechol 2,3-dioxygenase n=1 Tax=Pseudonocardia sp. TaxID=60912 RepID=UPI0026296C9C|nr:3-carboxyethylcatechol 2,3-dioxygenase [Pseudonocardia sp.]MCU1625696.1 extradiol dioxygenase [Pseudonocardia sp.]